MGTVRLDPRQFGPFGGAAAEEAFDKFWIWPLILVSGLVSLVMLSRAGTSIFWRTTAPSGSDDRVHLFEIMGVSLLLLGSPILVIFGGEVTAITSAAATQLFDFSQSVDALLPQQNMGGQ